MNQQQQRAINNLEMSLNRPKPEHSNEIVKISPQFVERIKDQVNLIEGEQAYFSARLNHSNISNIEVANIILLYC